MSEKKSNTIVKGTGVVGGLTVVSRALGFLRDLILARVFGASYLTDAFFVAFRIPNLLRSFMAEGALTSAFVPVFASELSEGREQAQRTLHSTCLLSITITLCLTLVGFLIAPWIVSILGAGFTRDPEIFTLCVKLTRVMLPYIVFVSLIAVINGALNNLKIFGAAPLAQITMNAVLIVGAGCATFTSNEQGIHLLSIAVLVGGALQVLVQLPSLKRAELSIFPKLPLLTPATKQILTLMGPAILGAAVYQLSLVISTLFATMLPAGSVSWLYYADRLVQLPIGIFTIALASVLLPTLSTDAAEGNDERFVTNLSDALRYVSFVIIPCAGVLFVYAEPLVQFLFEGGRFSRDYTVNTALAVKMFSLGIWSISCTSIGMRAFLAKKDTKTPCVIGIATVFVTAIASLYLMGALDSNGSNLIVGFVVSVQQVLHSVWAGCTLQHSGLALASSIGATFSFLVSIQLIGRRHNSFNLTPFVKATAISANATLGMCWGLTYWVSSFPPSFFSIVAGLLVSAVIYLGLSFVLRSRELKDAIRYVF